MAFLKLEWRSSMGPLDCGRTWLRHPEAGDYDAWATLRDESRAFLQPWEPSWAHDELTRSAYRRRLRTQADDIQAGIACPFHAFRKSDGALIGGITLRNIRRGAAQTGTLGYWMGEAFSGQGYMSEIVLRISGHGFHDLRLHRLEAACVPENAGSRRVLEKAGFTLEGRARSYLKINGMWRDHVLYGLVNPSE